MVHERHSRLRLVLRSLGVVGFASVTRLDACLTRVLMALVNAARQWFEAKPHQLRVLLFRVGVFQKVPNLFDIRPRRIYD